MAQKFLFSMQDILKRVFYGLFRPKIRNGKNDNFWAQSWITTQEKSNFSTIDEGHFYSLEMRIFYVEYIQRVFYELVWLKKKKKKKGIIDKFLPKPCVTPLEKISIFLWATNTFFMTLTNSSFNQLNNLSEKTENGGPALNYTQFPILTQKHVLTPLEKTNKLVALTIEV